MCLSKHGVVPSRSVGQQLHAYLHMHTHKMISLVSTPLILALLDLLWLSLSVITCLWLISITQEPEEIKIGDPYDVYQFTGSKRRHIQRYDYVPILKSLEAILRDSSVLKEIEHSKDRMHTDGRLDVMATYLEIVVFFQVIRKPYRLLHTMMNLR